MGFVLVIIGLLMVITGARGTYAQFGAQVASEFTAQPGGGPSFTTWLLAIGAVGALGYIPTLQIISRWLMALVVISLFLSQKGFFAKLQTALNTSPTPPNVGTGSIAAVGGGGGANPATAQSNFLTQWLLGGQSGLSGGAMVSPGGISPPVGTAP